MLICQLTDLHVRPAGATGSGSETTALTEQACRAVANLASPPDIVLITGDLVENGLATEYQALAAILRSTLTMPVYVIPGNHDRRESLRTELAHLPNIAAGTEFIQYTVEDHPVRLVMLDTLVPGASHGALSSAQLDWLDQTLAAQPHKPTLVAMHHPPFATGIPPMDRITLRQPDEFRAVISRHRQVQRIVCGHHHRPVIGHCAHAIASIAPSVGHQIALSFDATKPGAFTFEPPGFHLHLWLPDGLVTHTVYTNTYPGPFPFQSLPTKYDTA